MFLLNSQNKHSQFFSGANVIVGLFVFLLALDSAWSAPAQETYKDLIHKAQNLSLQRDRLQACQLLARAIAHETRNTSAYREMVRTLDELSGVFYTEKAQNTFSLAESLVAAKPKEAVEKYLEALRLEEGNVATLKAMARAQLELGACDAADATVKTADGYHPFSGELRLLKLQILECQKNFDALSVLLQAHEADADGVEKYYKALIVSDAIRKKEYKKAKQSLASWSSLNPGYPEIDYWRWILSVEQKEPEFEVAEKYLKQCREMTVRRRKSFAPDVYLCKNVSKVESEIKTAKENRDHANPEHD